jgi:hypothetical protein
MILAALFFGLITLGFTLLTVVPFVLLFLMLGVYLEPPRTITGRESAGGVSVVEDSSVR